MDKYSPFAKVEMYSENGRTQIYIDGKPLTGVLSFSLEQDPAKEICPILTIRTRCTLFDVSLDSVLLPLPAPWNLLHDPVLKDISDALGD